MSCLTEQDAAEFMKQVTENPDYVKEFTSDRLRITCTYKPTEFMTLTELRPYLNQTGTIPGAVFEETKKLFEHTYYFGLKIASTDGSDVLTRSAPNSAQYTWLVNELTYHLGNAVFVLTENSDTIMPVTYDYQRSYGLSPDAVFLFAFPENGFPESRFDLVFADRYFGISGPLKFRYRFKDLHKKAPKIKEVI